jgi:hypothetical protein
VVALGPLISMVRVVRGFHSCVWEAGSVNPVAAASTISYCWSPATVVDSVPSLNPRNTVKVSATPFPHIACGFPTHV